MVDRAFRRQFDFTQTPLDYKSNDLKYRLLEEDYKKAVRGQRSAQSTINKMAMGLETLRNGGQDLQEANLFHPDTTGLQIQWPGIQCYCRKTTKKGSGAQGQPTAPSIKWPWAWKHSEIVWWSSESQNDITQTPLDHRCIDLECKLLKRP